MKSFRRTSILFSSVMALSACVQPGSTAPNSARAQTAGPVSIEGDRTATAVGGCKTQEGNDYLAKIADAADALFQIISTDASDLMTVHERAYALAQLEQDYAENFAAACAGPGLTEKNTADRIEKLGALGRETVADVIRKLAAEIWDLFNPNVAIAGGDGASSPNPFAEATKP